MMTPNTLYHIFNRGNQRQKIFLREKNYNYFLRKVDKAFKDDISLLAFCLMPNHFHFLAATADRFNPEKFSNRLGIMLRSYTRGIQVQEDFVGSLFQQNTKKKPLPGLQDALYCFDYIHQNPVKAQLVQSADEWRYSSFNEYLYSTPQYCNISLARELLDLPIEPDQFYNQFI